MRFSSTLLPRLTAAVTLLAVVVASAAAARAEEATVSSRPAPAAGSATMEPDVRRALEAPPPDPASHADVPSGNLDRDVLRCGGARCAPAAAEPVQGSPCCLPCLRWHITLGGWIWGASGTVSRGGRTAQVDSDWTDTLEHIDQLEFALNTRVRAEWHRWAATLEVDGAKVADSIQLQENGTGVGGSVSVWFAQAQVGYRFTDLPLGCGPCAPVACVEAYAGLRAYFTDATLEASGVGAKVSGGDNWVDPIVGLRLAVDLSPHWTALVEGDIGGFGVGSTFSWHLLGALGYRFSDSLALHAGWKVLDFDRTSGASRLDLTLSGPFLALTFSF